MGTAAQIEEAVKQLQATLELVPSAQTALATARGDVAAARAAIQDDDADTPSQVLREVAALRAASSGASALAETKGDLYAVVQKLTDHLRSLVAQPDTPEALRTSAAEYLAAVSDTMAWNDRSIAAAHELGEADAAFRNATREPDADFPTAAAVRLEEAARTVESADDHLREGMAETQLRSRAIADGGEDVEQDSGGTGAEADSRSTDQGQAFADPVRQPAEGEANPQATEQGADFADSPPGHGVATPVPDDSPD